MLFLGLSERFWIILEPFFSVNPLYLLMHWEAFVVCIGLVCQADLCTWTVWNLRNLFVFH